MATVKVVLGWSFTQDLAKPADEFRIKRHDTSQLGAGNDVTLPAVLSVSGQTAYTADDLAVTYGASYIYTVSSHNQGGDTPVSVTVVVIVPAPPAVTNLTAQVVAA